MLRRAGLIILLGALAAQAGHLLAYQTLFGAASQQLQSSGAHAYFPALVKTAIGAMAAISIGGLFLAGLARVLGGRIQQGDAPAFVRLLAAVFTIQLAIFIGQETVEAALSGTPGASIDALLLIGTLGQLPVALLAAFALRFLLVEVVPALAEVRRRFTPAQPPGFVPVLTRLPAARAEDVLRSRLATPSVRKRGPPSF